MCFFLICRPWLKVANFMNLSSLAQSCTFSEFGVPSSKLHIFSFYYRGLSFSLLHSEPDLHTHTHRQTLAHTHTNTYTNSCGGDALRGLDTRASMFHYGEMVETKIGFFLLLFWESWLFYKFLKPIDFKISSSSTINLCFENFV